MIYSHVMEKKEKESDLSPPLEQYLVDRGYSVRCEVNHCDIIAEKSGTIIGIELKRSLNLSLLVQCNERQRICDAVYAAIPEPANWRRDRKWRKIERVLRRMEIGLVFIHTRRADPVKIVLHPGKYTPQKSRKGTRALLEELHSRSINLNNGGVTKTEIVTAYREKAIQIAVYLNEKGPLRVKELKKLGTEEKTASILQKNFYGWFIRVERGLYSISPNGRTAMVRYPELMEYYKTKLNNRETGGTARSPETIVSEDNSEDNKTSGPASD